MGNSAPAPAPEEPPIIKDDGYNKWPDNLYTTTEMRDMAAAVSFLVYAFAYASDVTRNVGLQGLDLTDKGRFRSLPLAICHAALHLKKSSWNSSKPIEKLAERDGRLSRRTTSTQEHSNQ
jgi:hypothetical protein